MSTVAVAAAPVAVVGFGPVLLALGVVGLAIAAGLSAETRRLELDAEEAEREELRDRLMEAIRKQSEARRQEAQARAEAEAKAAKAAAEAAARAAEAERQALLEAALCRAAAALRAEIDQLADAGERARLSAELDRLQDPLRAEMARGRDTRATRLLTGLRLQIAALRAEQAMPPRREVPAGAPETAALAAEIADYAERAAFFDEHEAAALRPLVEEARRSADRFRLGLIREQVKSAYGRLKEEAALTALFRQDLREFLPLVRKAEGPEAEALGRRLEDLLAAPVLIRADYERAYEAARTLFSEQMDRIADAVLAEKVGAGLADLGYELLDEAGRPVTLAPGAVHTLDLPGEGAGYRVRVKVEGGGLAVRLLRVVGSEAERAHLSDYQRQRDLEAGRKWCADLDRLYRALADAGIPLRDQLRREPGEEPLEVVADAAAGRARSAAERDADHERARAARS